MVRRDARILIKPDSTIVEATDAALDLLGMSLAELQALPPGGLSLEEDRAASEGFAEAWQEQGGGEIIGAGTVKLLDGRLVRVRYLITTLSDGLYEVTLERSAEAVTEPPRTYSVGKVLSSWRAAERKLSVVTTDTPEWEMIQSEIEHFRSEYRRLARSERATSSS
ncbi:MAG: hypothetical protein ABIZ34_02115 [Candidatus Limnocylindrales bacterium]